MATTNPDRSDAGWAIWQDRERCCPLHGFFQTSDWGRLLCRHFPFYRPAPILAEDFFLPLIRHHRWGGPSDSLYGMPWMTNGGVLATFPEDPDLWKRVWKALAQTSVGTAVVACQPGTVLPDTLPGLSAESGITHLLSLEPGWERLWGAFDRHCRTEVRKARKQGVEVRESKSEQAIEAHWDLVSAEFDRWRPVPAPTLEFVREAVALPAARLYQALHEDRAVVSLLAFTVPNEIFFWQGARTRVGYPKGSNNLLFSEVIRFAAEAGIGRVNFGGSLGNRSIARFKEDFGAVPSSFPILKKTHPLVGWARQFMRG